jgi:anti-sigma regulatory factor (Ser/Thr protein kinase)
MQVLDYHIEANLNYNEEEIDNFISHCEDIINNSTQNKNTAFKLKMAVHELVVNCVEHGYQKKSGIVNFSLKKLENKIFLEVSDNGKGFEFNTFDFDKKNTCLDEIHARGWGLLIINRLVDKMDIATLDPLGTKVTITVTD